MVTPSAAYADAYATVCMVLGPEDGAAWIDSLQQAGKPVDALFIMAESTDAYSFWATPRMREQLTWLSELPEANR